MTYQKVIQDIKKGILQPVYVLYGTEYYFIEEVKTYMEKLMTGNNNGDVISYDLRENSLQEVITDVETFPFFSEKKLIIAHHPVFLQANPEKVAANHDVPLLNDYLQNPVSYSTLLFIAPFEKLDARKKITKELKKHAVMVDCNPVKGKAFQHIIKQMAEDEKIELTKDTYALLENEFQDNLYMLQKEMHKLASYAGEGNKVTKEIAEEIISPSNTFTALQLVDAVLKNDLAQAIKICKELEKMKEEPIGLIALLAYQFRITFQVKLLKQKGYSTDRMKGELKVHPYVVQLAVERSKFFTVQHLSLIINLLMQADQNIKTGKMDKGIAFQMLLYQLINIKKVQ